MAPYSIVDFESLPCTARIAGRGLVMPNIAAGIGVDGHDRRGVQIVAALRTPDFPVRGLGVTGTEVQSIEFRVERHGIPDVAAAAELPPLPRPRLRSAIHDLIRCRAVLGAWLSRHQVEAPDLSAGLGDVCGDVAPNRREISSRVSDHNL